MKVPERSHPDEEARRTLAPPSDRPIRRTVRPRSVVNATLHSGILIQKKDLPPDAIAALREAFTYSNPEYSKRARLGLWVGGTPKTIESYEFHRERDAFFFPRGGLTKVEKVVNAIGMDLKIEDRRLSLDDVVFEPTRSAKALELREDQHRMLAAILRTETCVVRAATGSGKTEVAIELARQLGQPTLVIVWSSGLLKQWVSRICDRWGWKESQIGILGDGKKRIRDVTVAMQQTLRLSTGIEEQFGLIIGDEVQRWAAKTFRELIGRFPARYRVGFSADERRKDRLENLIHDAFGPVAAEISRQELVARGDLCDVEIIVIPTEFRIDEIERTPVTERGSAVGKLWIEILTRLTNDPVRNSTICDLAAHSVENGRSVLVFSDRVDHVRLLSRTIALARGIPCGLFLGGVENRQAFNETRDRLDAGAIRCAVGTSCIYQGLDIPRLEVGIVATPTGSNRQLFEQQVGRLRRKFPGKERGRLYYLWDEHVFPSHLSNILGWYGDRLVRVGFSGE